MKYFIWLLTVACAQITWAQPDTLWTRQFGGPADDMINAFCPDGRGGYLAAGECGFNGDEIGPQNMYVCNLDSVGNMIWQQEIGLPDSFEMAYGVAVAQNGDALVAGDDHIFPNGAGPGRLARLDALGNVIWNRTYSNELGSVHLARVAELPGGDLLVAGTCLTATNDCDMYLLRLTSSGDSIRSRTFGDTTQEIINDFLIAANGDFVLSGKTFRTPTELYWIRLARTDSDGNLLWMREYDAGEGDTFVAGEVKVAEMPNGNLGLCSTRSRLGLDIWLMRVTADGDSLRSGIYECDQYNTDAGDLAASEDGGLVVAGSSGSWPSYRLEFLKESADGSLAWHFTLSTETYSAVLTNILAVPDQCYLVAGTRWNFSNQADGLLIKIGPDVPEAVDAPTVGLPQEISLTAYPNPFNAVTTISLILPRATEGRVILYDLTGRRESAIAEQTFAAGENRITIDARGLTSGMHILALESDHVLATHKLLLLK